MKQKMWRNTIKKLIILTEAQVLNLVNVGLKNLTDFSTTPTFFSRAPRGEKKNWGKCEFKEVLTFYETK